MPDRWCGGRNSAATAAAPGRRAHPARPPRGAARRAPDRPGGAGTGCRRVRRLLALIGRVMSFPWSHARRPCRSVTELSGSGTQAVSSRYATGAVASSESSRSIDAAVAGQQVAHVLDADVALEHGFAEVTEGGSGDGGKPEDDARARPSGAAGTGTSARRSQAAGDDRAAEALPGLAGRDPRAPACGGRRTARRPRSHRCR